MPCVQLPQGSVAAAARRIRSSCRLTRPERPAFSTVEPESRLVVRKSRSWTAVALVCTPPSHVRLVNDWLIWGTGAGMATMSAFEAKTRFGELLDRVSKGEEVVITRHDKPVAGLVPEGAQRLDDVRRTVTGLLDLQQRIRRRSKVTLSDREARSAIDEGRL